MTVPIPIKATTDTATTILIGMIIEDCSGFLSLSLSNVSTLVLSVSRVFESDVGSCVPEVGDVICSFGLFDVAAPEDEVVTAAEEVTSFAGTEVVGGGGGVSVVVGGCSVVLAGGGGGTTIDVASIGGVERGGKMIVTS